MDVWEVFSRRTTDDPLVHVGAVKAPDAELALVLAREAFFRHGEGVDCWIARRADLRRVSHPETLGGVTDKSYRRQEGYVGVGAKLKRITKQLAGSRIDRPRPDGKR
jgi:ring-1,2-phenylacetyl-CoA epoxidase subunit PaaB